MRIGIDAKWYFKGPISNRIVVKNLVDHMICLDTQSDIVIILDKKYKKTNLPNIFDGVSIVYIWNPNTLISNLFCLPNVVKKQRL